MRCEAPYFTAQAFSRDGRWLVFAGGGDRGRELYRLDIHDGTVNQLTRDSGLSGGALTMHPNGRRVIWSTDRTLVSCDIESGAVDTLVDLSGEPRTTVIHPAVPSLNVDGKAALIVLRHGESSQIRLADLEGGSTESLVDMPGLLTHPQFCPSDDQILTFVPPGDACWDMSLPRERRARLWSLDLRDGVPRRLLNPSHGHTATHESWSADGSRIFFFEKTQPNWTPCRVRSIRCDGSDWQTHFTSDHYRLGHGRVSPSGRHFVADVQCRGHSPLFLIDLQTGDHEVLCWPDASNDGGHVASAHVHPSFSPDGSMVVYTSDVSGVPQVYLVPTPEAASDA
ncbi:MAG: oligogalacturonate lyase family protein [Planctomycetota bacterium]